MKIGIEVESGGDGPDRDRNRKGTGNPNRNSIPKIFNANDECPISGYS